MADVRTDRAFRTGSRSTRRVRAALVVATGLLVVANACADGVARLPDCIDCRPVEMSIDQPLEIELGSDRAITNDPDAYTWTVADPGTMTLVSETRGQRSEDEDEFIGGYSRFVVYTFEPTRAGSTRLRFELVPADDPAAEPVNELDITVRIAE